MVLEGGVLPPPLQLYAAAAAHLSPRPPWAPLLQFPGAVSLLGMQGAFAPSLGRPRYPHGLSHIVRAPPGPPSEDSGSETHVGKGEFSVILTSTRQSVCFDITDDRLTGVMSLIIDLTGNWSGRSQADSVSVHFAIKTDT